MFSSAFVVVRGDEKTTLCLWYPFFVVIVREFLLWCDVRHDVSVLVKEKTFLSLSLTLVLTHSIENFFFLFFLFVCRRRRKSSSLFDGNFDGFWSFRWWMADFRLFIKFIDFNGNFPGIFHPKVDDSGSICFFLLCKTWDYPHGMNLHWVIVCVSINNHRIFLICILVIYVRITDWNVLTMCVKKPSMWGFHHSFLMIFKLFFCSLLIFYLFLVFLVNFWVYF